MKRTLSLVLALVMVLGTFTMAFAEMADEQVMDGETLKDLGVLTGSESGDLMLDRALTRQEAVVLISRLMGEEEIAANFPVEEAYPDEESDFYSPYLAWAKDNGTFTGNAEGNFQPTETITTKQFAKVLLTVLGYEQDVDFTFDESLEMAVELDFMPEGVEEVVMTRGTMAVVTVAVLSVNSKDGDMTLAEKLGLELPEPPAPTALEVEEVVTTNLKSFTVVFNQAVKTAEVAVKNADGKVAISDLVMSDDMMSAMGYYEEAQGVVQSSVLTFTINAETAEELKVEDLEVEKIVTDTMVPAALSAKALNPKQVEILFSEPMNFENTNIQLLSNIKIDDDAVVASSSVSYTDNKVVLTLLAPMTEGTRTLEVASVKDFADFVAPTATFDILVVKDETAPEAIKAEIKDNSTIIVTFNEPLDKIGIGEFTVDGEDVTVTLDSFVEKTNYTQVKLELDEPLSIGATVEVKVGYKGQTDIMGNEVEKYKYITTSISDDTTLPKVVSVVVGKLNKLVVTFSKPMTKIGEIEILDKDGKEFKEAQKISVIGEFKSSNTVIEFKGSDLGLDKVDPAVYTVKLTDMKDASIRTNPLGTYTETFTSVDTLLPTVDEYYKYDPAKTANDDGDWVNKITIYFSEAMNKESIENLANYMEGNPLHVQAEYTGAKASADKKSVTITYVTETEKAVFAEEINVLTAVKDEAGNNLVKIYDVNVIPSGEDKLFVKANEDGNEAELTALNTIKVYFNSNVDTVYPSLFKIEGSTNYFINATVNKNVVTLTTAKNLENKAYKLVVVDPKLIKNKFGENLIDADLVTSAKDLEVVVAEKIAPTIAKVEAVKGQNEAIKFTFSEKVDIAMDSFDNLVIRKNGTHEDVVVAIYAVDDKGIQTGTNLIGANIDSVKTVIVYLDRDVKGYEVAFPLLTTGIQDEALAPNQLETTNWLEIK